MSFWAMSVLDGIVATGLLVPLAEVGRGASTRAWRTISRRSAAVAARSCLAATVWPPMVDLAHGARPLSIPLGSSAGQ